MGRCILILTLGLALSALAPTAAAAQTVPVDTAAVLVDVARQFEAEGRRDLALAIYEIIADRYAGTFAASEALTRLALLRSVKAVNPDRSGRTELLVTSTLYGLWLGAAVPATFGADNLTPYGIGLLVGAPAGLLLARQALSGRPISEGQARAITFGAVWGTWQGVGWRYVLGIGDRVDPYWCDPAEYSCSDDYVYTETSSSAVFGAMIVGGLGGIGTSALLASRGPISADQMAVANFGALWGSWYGLAASLLIDGEAEQGKFIMAAALIGGDLGLVIAASMAPQWDLSRSRARLISVAGVGGAVAGFGLDLLVKPSSGRVVILIPALTSVAGLVAGTLWTRGHDDDDLRQGAGGHEESGALLNLRSGRAGLGLALPEPVLIPADRAGTRQALGARFTLLRATF